MYIHVHVCKLSKLEKFEKKLRLKTEKPSMVFRDDDWLISRYQGNEKCILRECEMSYWWGKM